MNTNLIKAQIIVTWYELYQQGIGGLLKGDIVLIREINHHISTELGQCALATDNDKQKEWVIPVKYLNIVNDENKKDIRTYCTQHIVKF